MSMHGGLGEQLIKAVEYGKQGVPVRTTQEELIAHSSIRKNDFHRAS